MKLSFMIFFSKSYLNSLNKITGPVIDKRQMRGLSQPIFQRLPSELVPLAPILHIELSH